MLNPRSSGAEGISSGLAASVVAFSIGVFASAPACGSAGLASGCPSAGCDAAASAGAEAAFTAAIAASFRTFAPSGSSQSRTVPTENPPITIAWSTSAARNQRTRWLLEKPKSRSSGEI